jgi:DNA-binding MarR family transcriptional regulator
MHQILFNLKRAFRNSVTFSTRRFLGEVGLTPSRFDILYLLWGTARSQVELRRILGIASSTLSEILQRLEARGWIRRSRALHDGRTFLVELTKWGRARGAPVLKQLITHKIALRVVREIFGWRQRRWNGRERAWDAMDRLEGALQSVERWFGPRVARLYYPSYHPEEYSYHAYGEQSVSALTTTRARG